MVAAVVAVIIVSGCVGTGPLIPPRMSNYTCNSDDDCMLVNENGIFDGDTSKIECCHSCGEIIVDYSSDEWIVVGTEFWEENQRIRDGFYTQKCGVNVICPTCEPVIRVFNDHYEARCINKLCAKHSILNENTITPEDIQNRLNWNQTLCEQFGGTFRGCGPNACQLAGGEVCPHVCGPPICILSRGVECITHNDCIINKGKYYTCVEGRCLYLGLPVVSPGED